MSNNTTGADYDAYIALAPSYISSTELVFGISGTIGNTFVILVVLTTAKMRTLTNFMILNLAVADFFTSFLLITNKYVTQAFTLTVPTGLAGDVFCRLYYSAVFFWISIKASTFNLLLMTYETYIAVVHPLFYPKYRSKRNIVISVTVSWIISFILEIVFIQFHGNEETGCYLFRFNNQSLGIFLGVFNFVVTFFIPMILLVWACYKIQSCLKTSMVHTSSNAEEGSRAQKSQLAHKRIVKTLYLVILAYAICWTPDSILFLASNVGAPVEYEADYFNALVLLAFANCLLNPLIYLFKYKQFRDNFLKKFCPCLVKRLVGPDPNDGASVTLATQNTS